MAFKEGFELVVGLEVHVQLKTKSKAFAPDANAYGNLPNTHLSTVTLAHPGTLPKVNKTAIEYAIKMGLACQSQINHYNCFDRKSYFYPDLPKGYQITQDKTPICQSGQLTIFTKETGEKNIQINRIHLEEDAGKSLHLADCPDTLIDLNRAGVPLIEIVSEPDIHHPAEAHAYLSQIRRLVRYLDISDGNMEEGSLRCDANVSVRRKGETKLGQKTEVKNMNSFKNVQRAIVYEWERQCDLLQKGQPILQETRNFDTQSGTTTAMRMKETLNDYRYFPDPDLPPFIVSEEYIADIRKNMPLLPAFLFDLFTQKYGLSAYDARVLTDEKEIALYFQELCQHTPHYKVLANWILGPIKGYLNELTLPIERLPLGKDQIISLVDMVASGKLSFSVASQKLLRALLKQPSKTPEALAREMDILQDDDQDKALQMISEVMDAFPDKVEAYRKGKKGLLGMLMGEIMKKSKGKINPKKVNQLLRQKLNHCEKK